MAEIAVLRTHIINYAKTRETYVAYRQAGYSKKFRQEHEEEILLHQAAKMPLMIWVSRSCPKLGNCKLNMLSCWRKRKNLCRVPPLP